MEEMKKLLAVILLQVAVSVQAQTEPEYRLELGGGVGMVTYLGDFNANIFKNAQPMFTAMAKYRFNPRKALALNVSYGTLKGTAKDDKSYYPGLDGYTFKHNLLDIGLRGELNFWPYGTGEDYRGAKRLTPYIYIGLGMTICKADKTATGLNLPLGAGVKYKVASRVNMALEWTMHFTSSDNLDGIADPYGIKSSGLFKNTDCYSHLRLSLSYDLWAKCRTCHNDKD
jgi:opacity protein-like surface antigen